MLACRSEFARERDNWATLSQLKPSPSSLAYDSHEIIRLSLTCEKRKEKKKMAIQWENILINVKGTPRCALRLMNRKLMILNKIGQIKIRSQATFENVDIYKGPERKPLWMSVACQKSNRLLSERRASYSASKPNKEEWTGRLPTRAHTHALTHQPRAREWSP